MRAANAAAWCLCVAPCIFTHTHTHGRLRVRGCRIRAHSIHSRNTVRAIFAACMLCASGGRCIINHAECVESACVCVCGRVENRAFDGWVMAWSDANTHAQTQARTREPNETIVFMARGAHTQHVPKCCGWKGWHIVGGPDCRFTLHPPPSRRYTPVRSERRPTDTIDVCHPCGHTAKHHAHAASLHRSPPFRHMVNTAERRRRHTCVK